MEFNRNFSSSESPIVEFKGVKNGYLVGLPVDVHCVFVNYVPKTSDWIGLFRVGWTIQKDYFSYVYAPVPTRCSNGKDYEINFKFSESKIPDEEGCLYQFVYISSDKRVLGVSNSFQFKDSLVEEFSEYNVGGQSFVETKWISESGDNDNSVVEQELIKQLKNEILRLEKSQLTSFEKIAQLETELSSLQNEKASLLAKTDVDEKLVLNLNAKLNNVSQEKIRLAENVTKLENDVKELEEDLKQYMNSLAYEQEINRKSYLELEEKQNMKMKLAEMVNESKDKIRIFMDNEKFLGGQITNLQDLLKKRSSLLELERNKCRMLEEKIEKSDVLNARVKELLANNKQQFEELSLTRKMLESECQSLKIEKSRSGDLEKKVMELTEFANKLQKSSENEKQTLQKEVDRLNNLLAFEKHRLAQELDTLHSKHVTQMKEQEKVRIRELNNLKVEKMNISAVHANEMKHKNEIIVDVPKDLEANKEKVFTYEFHRWV